MQTTPNTPYGQAKSVQGVYWHPTIENILGRVRIDALPAGTRMRFLRILQVPPFVDNLEDRRVVGVDPSPIEMMS